MLIKFKVQTFQTIITATYINIPRSNDFKVWWLIPFTSHSESNIPIGVFHIDFIGKNRIYKFYFDPFCFKYFIVSILFIKFVRQFNRFDTSSLQC